MSSTEHFQNQLLLLRKKKNLSQKRAAAMLGLRDPITLSRYERGLVLPQFTTALRMQALYEAPLHVIFAELYSSLRAEMQENAQGQSATQAAA